MTALAELSRLTRVGSIAMVVGAVGTLAVHALIFLALGLSSLVTDPWDIEVGPPPGGIEIGFDIREAPGNPQAQVNAAAATVPAPEPSGGQLITEPPPRRRVAPPSTSNDPDPPPRPRRRPRMASDTETSNVAREARDSDAGVGTDQDGGMAVAAADTSADGGVTGGARGPDPGTGVLGSLARRGALVTLLLRMDRVRASSLAPDLSAMLAAIPDWRNLVGGSGMDPVRDLDALVVATPNPWDARRLAVVARYTVEEARLEEMIAAAQEASGGGAQPMQEQDGIRIAPGLVSDGTERNLALLGDRTLALARPNDLPRLLATARARSTRRGGDPPSAAEALSSLFETQGSAEDAPVAVLEADGVRRFMQSRAGMPTSARFVMTEGSDGGAHIDGIGWYDDAEQAQAAQRYWDGRRLQFVQNDLNRLFFGSLVLALRTVRITAYGSSLHVLADVRRNEARRLIRLAQRIFVARGRELADGGVGGIVGDGGVPTRVRTSLDGGVDLPPLGNEPLAPSGPETPPSSRPPPPSSAPSPSPTPSPNPWPSLRPRTEPEPTTP